MISDKSISEDVLLDMVIDEDFLNRSDACYPQIMPPPILDCDGQKWAYYAWIMTPGGEEGPVYTTWAVDGTEQSDARYCLWIPKRHLP